MLVDMVVVAFLPRHANWRWRHEGIITSGGWCLLLLGYIQPIDMLEIFRSIHRIRTQPIALRRRVWVVTGLHLSCLLSGDWSGRDCTVIRFERSFLSLLIGFWVRWSSRLLSAGVSYQSAEVVLVLVCPASSIKVLAHDSIALVRCWCSSSLGSLPCVEIVKKLPLGS